MDYPVKTLNQLRPILVGFRKHAGLTQEAMAQRLGISQQSYAAFEANPETASVERLFRVLRLFDVEIKLAAPQTQASQAIAETTNAMPRRSRTPAVKTASAAAPSAARKRNRATPSADEPRSKSASHRKPKENW
nr:helix-turn-helix transcriptional regulator [Paraburkholderia lycopersici]